MAGDTSLPESTFSISTSHRPRLQGPQWDFGRTHTPSPSEKRGSLGTIPQYLMTQQEGPGSHLKRVLWGNTNF